MIAMPQGRTRALSAAHSDQIQSLKGTHPLVRLVAKVGIRYCRVRKQVTNIQCDRCSLDSPTGDATSGAAYRERQGQRAFLPGGSGKTTMNLKDKGLIEVCYFAPSWKLARNKQEELGVRCNVHYNLTCQDPSMVYQKIQRSCNVLVIDEISMLDNKMKELIFERFKMCKIIMCGDNGYQLDGFNSRGDTYISFTETGFDNIVEHNHNYRVKCDELRKHLEVVRHLIKSNPKEVRQYVLNNYKNIDTIQDYNVEDMILTRTHVLKDMYTQKYKHLDKYYVINTETILKEKL